MHTYVLLVKGIVMTCFSYTICSLVHVGKTFFLSTYMGIHINQKSLNGEHNHLRFGVMDKIMHRVVVWAHTSFPTVPHPAFVASDSHWVAALEDVRTGTLQAFSLRSSATQQMQGMLVRVPACIQSQPDYALLESALHSSDMRQTQMRLGV